MIINLIGDCDKRPVLYTLLKVCQTLGDVLLVTSSTRLVRLSDTGDTYGHYQNIMIGVTTEGIDDFFTDFKYDIIDFEYVIIDNIVAAEADLTIYVQGMLQSEREQEMLEFIEHYETINLYSRGMLSSNTLQKMEEFEALKDMCVVAPKVAEKVANILSKPMKASAKNLLGIALATPTGQKKPSALPGKR